MNKKVLLCLMTITQPLCVQANPDNLTSFMYAALSASAGLAVGYAWSNSNHEQSSLQTINAVQSQHHKLQYQFSDALNILTNKSLTEKQRKDALHNHMKLHFYDYQNLPHTIDNLTEGLIASKNQYALWKMVKKDKTTDAQTPRADYEQIQRDHALLKNLYQEFLDAYPYIQTSLYVQQARNGIAGIHEELINTVKKHGTICQLQNMSDKKKEDIRNDLIHVLSRNQKGSTFLVTFVKNVDDHIQTLDQNVRNLKASAASAIDQQFTKQAEEYLEILKISKSLVINSDKFLQEKAHLDAFYDAERKANEERNHNAKQLAIKQQKALDIAEIKNQQIRQNNIHQQEVELARIQAETDHIYAAKNVNKDLYEYNKKRVVELNQEKQKLEEEIKNIKIERDRINEQKNIAIACKNSLSDEKNKLEKDLANANKNLKTTTESLEKHKKAIAAAKEVQSMLKQEADGMSPQSDEHKEFAGLANRLASAITII